MQADCACYTQKTNRANSPVLKRNTRITIIKTALPCQKPQPTIRYWQYMGREKLFIPVFQRKSKNLLFLILVLIDKPLHNSKVIRPRKIAKLADHNRNGNT